MQHWKHREANLNLNFELIDFLHLLNCYKIQAMYFVPQVRSAVANLRLHEINPKGSPGDPDRAMWNLIELYANMDLAQIAALVDDVELLPSLGISPLELSNIGDASFDVVTKLAMLIESHSIDAQSPDNEEIERLIGFTSGYAGCLSARQVPSR